MRSRGITYLVDRFHCGVHRCIKTDGILCTCNIKVNRSRKTDRVDAECRQLLRTSERSVTADNDNSVDSMLLADLCCSLLTFRCLELHAACCL